MIKKKNNFETLKDATPRTKSRAMCAQTYPDMDAVTAAKSFIIMVVAGRTCHVSRSDRSTSTMCFGDQSFHQETDALSCGTGQWKTPRITLVPLKTKNRKTKLHSIMPYASPKLEMHAEIQHSVWGTIRVSVERCALMH